MPARMPRLRSSVILAVLAVTTVVVVLRSGWLAYPVDVGRSVTALLVGPLASSGEWVGNAAASFVRVGSLSARVRFLEQELAAATAESVHLQSLRKENDELRAALDLPQRSSGTLVTADVIGPATDGVSDVIRINRGVRHGVRAGAPVVSSGGVVVGRVAEALDFTAAVDLLSGGRLRVAARDADTGAEGVVRGLRGLDVIIEAIPRTDTIRPGDRLVTTGIDGAFPPHLFIGRVNSIRSPEYAVFQEASVQLPLVLGRLNMVSVISE